MRIAQISPLFESVPPKLYGGTERVVSYLTEELVAQGHEVTLFASGDSLTTANLVSCAPKATRLNPDVVDPFAYHALMFDRVARMAEEFDVLHFHTDYHHFPLFRSRASRVLTTLHGRLDLYDLPPVYNEFQDMRVVSISNHQRTPLPQAHWAGTVYHGLPTDLLPFHAEAGGYLAFLGRISREKGVDRAIEIAIKAGIPLKIAAKIDKPDIEYYEQIKPMMDHPLIEYVGEINERQKVDFLGGAMALLFPIDWPEPFGMVMIEAMSCGTPVIAWPNGSVPEVLDHGVSGFHVTSIDEAVAAVERAATHDRALVRRTFERRFSVERMTKDYLRLYEQTLARTRLESAKPVLKPSASRKGQHVPGLPHGAIRLS